MEKIRCSLSTTYYQNQSNSPEGEGSLLIRIKQLSFHKYSHFFLQFLILEFLDGFLISSNFLKLGFLSVAHRSWCCQYAIYLWPMLEIETFQFQLFPLGQTQRKLRFWPAREFKNVRVHKNSYIKNAFNFLKLMNAHFYKGIPITYRRLQYSQNYLLKAFNIFCMIL